MLINGIERNDQALNEQIRMWAPVICLDAAGPGTHTQAQTSTRMHTHTWTQWHTQPNMQYCLFGIRNLAAMKTTSPLLPHHTLTTNLITVGSDR